MSSSPRHLHQKLLCRASIFITLFFQCLFFFVFTCSFNIWGVGAGEFQSNTSVGQKLESLLPHYTVQLLGFQQIHVWHLPSIGRQVNSLFVSSCNQGNSNCLFWSVQCFTGWEFVCLSLPLEEISTAYGGIIQITSLNSDQGLANSSGGASRQWLEG